MRMPSIAGLLARLSDVDAFNRKAVGRDIKGRLHFVITGDEARSARGAEF